MFAALLPLLGPIVERLTALIPDPEARAKAQAEAMATLTAQLMAPNNGIVEVIGSIPIGSTT